MLEIPKHGCPVLLIERIPRINEGKLPVLHMIMFLPEGAHSMNYDLYPLLYCHGQLCCPPGGLRLLPYHMKQALCHHPTPCLSPSNQSDTWIFVQRYQTAAYQCAIVGP